MLTCDFFNAMFVFLSANQLGDLKLFVQRNSSLKVKSEAFLNKKFLQNPLSFWPSNGHIIKWPSSTDFYSWQILLWKAAQLVWLTIQMPHCCEQVAWEQKYHRKVSSYAKGKLSFCVNCWKSSQELLSWLLQMICCHLNPVPSRIMETQWIIYQTLLAFQYSCNTPAIRLQYACNTSAIRLQYACNTPAVLLQYACNTPAIRLQYSCNQC